MTAILSTRLTDGATPYPAMGTVPSAANQQFFRGTMVSLDASGNAVVPTDGDGFDVYGVQQAYLDNRTGSKNGGLAGDVDCQVHFGVYGWNILGTTPKPRQVLYVVDNQTVSTDSDGGARGIAGVCVEVRAMTGGVLQAFTLTGPQAFVEANLADLLANAVIGHIPVPLASFYKAAGTPLVAYADGTDGLELADSEAAGYRFNDDTTAAIWTSIAMPADLDDAEDVVVHILASRVGAADTTAVITVGAFFQTVGAAHTAGTSVGGATAALAAATTVIQEVTRTIAAADVPAAPAVLSLSLVPDAALDADDLRIHAVWLEYTKAL